MDYFPDVVKPLEPPDKTNDLFAPPGFEHFAQSLNFFAQSSNDIGRSRLPRGFSTILLNTFPCLVTTVTRVGSGPGRCSVWSTSTRILRVSSSTLGLAIALSVKASSPTFPPAKAEATPQGMLN